MEPSALFKHCSAINFHRFAHQSERLFIDVFFFGDDFLHLEARLVEVFVVSEAVEVRLSHRLRKYFLEFVFVGLEGSFVRFHNLY